MIEASSLFAILKPYNVAAKVDFDELIKKSGHRSLSSACVSTQQQYDREVFRSRIRDTKEDNANWDAVSVTSTECETDLEDDLGRIYSGYYTLDLGRPPKNPLIGWKIGEDLPLGRTYKAQGMRSCPAILNFHDCKTGFLSLLSRVRVGGCEVTVNGNTINHAKTFSLNQNPMQVRLGPLQYEFEYTAHASSSTYLTQRQAYFETWFNERGPIIDVAPTPVGQVRTFGQWTVNVALGRGTSGRVHFASNAKGDIAVLKVVDGTQEQALQEIEILKRLQSLPCSQTSQGRLVRLVDVIRPNGGKGRTGAPFEEIAIVLEPCVSNTFTSLCGSDGQGW